MIYREPSTKLSNLINTLRRRPSIAMQHWTMLICYRQALTSSLLWVRNVTAIEAMVMEMIQHRIRPEPMHITQHRRSALARKAPSSPSPTMVCQQRSTRQWTSYLMWEVPQSRSAQSTEQREKTATKVLHTLLLQQRLNDQLPLYIS